MKSAELRDNDHKLEKTPLEYQATIRYGGARQRYHLTSVAGADIRTVLTNLSKELPDEVAAEANLVEIRLAVDPEDRRYLGEED